jgi:hypothetical protein
MTALCQERKGVREVQGVRGVQGDCSERIAIVLVLENLVGRGSKLQKGYWLVCARRLAGPDSFRSMAGLWSAASLARPMRSEPWRKPLKRMPSHNPIVVV